LFKERALEERLLVSNGSVDVLMECDCFSSRNGSVDNTGEEETLVIEDTLDEAAEVESLSPEIPERSPDPISAWKTSVFQN
jgi:hypothetical protein